MVLYFIFDILDENGFILIFVNTTKQSNYGIKIKGSLTSFFFLFLDERNNQVRVTNCQSPLSPTKFLDLRRSDSHGNPNFLFLELVT